MLLDPRAAALVSRISPASGSISATCGRRSPNADLFFDFDDNLREAFQRETELFVQDQLHGRPKRDRPADRQLHVHERAAGAALRDSQRLRQPLPQGHVSRRPAGRAARPRQHAHGDLVSEPDLAGGARQVAAREPAGSAAAAAAAQRSGPARERRGRGSDDGARPAGAAPAEPGVRQLPRADGSARVRARELRRASASGATIDSRGQGRRSTRRARCPTAPSSAARSSSGPRCSKRKVDFVDQPDREAVCLWSGPGRRVVRHAGRPRRWCAMSATKDYRWSSIILGIVQSKPFQMRMPAEPAGTRAAAAQ